MTTLARIVRMLPDLATAELDELQARIKALRALGHAVLTDGDVRADESFVLSAIAETMRGHGTDHSSTAVLARAAAERVYDGSSFRDKVPGVMAFLAMAHPNRVGQRALLLLALQLLLLDLRRRGAIVSHKTMMANIHRVGPVLDAHFPGYARAGLLGWVVRQHNGTGDHA